MNISLIEIIKLLQAQGHEVEYTHRKDGGYIIRKIDGQRFSGKVGNTIARNMVGAKLSQARQVQLARIRLPKGRKYTKLAPLPEDVKKALRKVQRSWRKKHPDIRGTASTKNIRWYLKEHGKEATIQSLDKSYRYAQGLAYIDNVNFLLQRIQDDLNKEPNSALENVYYLIERHALDMKEEWMQPLHYDCLQEWERGHITGEECARRMRDIMTF